MPARYSEVFVPVMVLEQDSLCFNSEYATGTAISY
jgi:hypothetical protein